jgi:hypothetical protein
MAKRKAAIAGKEPPYRVMVDDNFNFMREDKRYEHGRFDTLKEAIAGCQRIVDEDLNSYGKSETSPSKVYETYSLFSRDPFIVGAPSGVSGVPFSAREYARRKLV